MNFAVAFSKMPMRAQNPDILIGGSINSTTIHVYKCIEINKIKVIFEVHFKNTARIYLQSKFS